MDYNLVFAKTVKVDSVGAGVNVTINDQYTASFAEHSNIVKLFNSNPDECISKLTGGSFFFVGDEFIDHRDSAYRGYIMTDADINEVKTKIGSTSNISKKDLKGFHLVTSGRSKHTLVKSHKRCGIALGSVELYHVWSPFSNNIRFSYRVTVEEGDVIFNRLLANHKISITPKNWYNDLIKESEICLTKVSKFFDVKLDSMKSERCLGSTLSAINEFARVRNVDAIVDDTSGTYAENEPTNLSKLQAWQYVVELIQYEAYAGDGKLYQLANNLLWGAE
jgi:hypothetical protein